jgi:hypothetical protein
MKAGRAGVPESRDFHAREKRDPALKDTLATLELRSSVFRLAG